MPALLPLDTLSFDLSHSSLLTHDLRTRTTLVGMYIIHLSARFKCIVIYLCVFSKSLVCVPYLYLFFFLLVARAPTSPLTPRDLWSHHPSPQPTRTSVLSPTSFPRHCLILVSCPPSSRRHPRSSFFVRTFHPRRLLLSFTFAYLHLPLVIPFSHSNIIYT